MLDELDMWSSKASNWLGKLYVSYRHQFEQEEISYEIPKAAY